ncbi:MAG: Uma2 family endonuclease [Pirellula sp.]
MILKTPHVSLAEYDSMVRKGAFDDLGRGVELIRGEIVEMNPAGPVHDDLITYLTDWSFEGRDKRITRITSQTGIDLPEIESRPEPDVFWVRRARYRDGHPQAADVQLAIEVADSSLVKDLEIKRRMYAEVGIVEYWIVDCQSNRIHVFRDPKDGDFQTHRIALPPETISPLIAPEAMLDLQDLFEGQT